ncbi:hypothetical protein KM043_011651 [Ampulex compressa]|nr:hypothetical protein KM043_011651 [Ampulex compressa]
MEERRLDARGNIGKAPSVFQRGRRCSLPAKMEDGRFERTAVRGTFSGAQEVLGVDSRCESSSIGREADGRLRFAEKNQGSLVGGLSRSKERVVLVLECAAGVRDPAEGRVSISRPTMRADSRNDRLPKSHVDGQ